MPNQNTNAALAGATGGASLVTVQVDGADFQTVREPDGWIGVVIKRLSERFGLGVSAQLERIKTAAWARDDLGNSVVRQCRTTGADGKSYRMACLPAELVAVWAETLDASAISDPGLREAMGRLQRMGAKILDAGFRGSPVALVTAEAAKEAREQRDIFAELIESNQQILGRQKRADDLRDVIAARLRLMPTTEYLDGVLEQKADKSDVDAVAAQLRAEMDALKEQLRQHDDEAKPPDPPTKKTTDEAYAVVARFYGGCCPVDRQTVLITPDGRRTGRGHMDHFRSKSIGRPDAVWLVADSTNLALKEPRSPEHQAVSAAFDEYQRLRRRVAEEKTAAAHAKAAAAQAAEDAKARRAREDAEFVARQRAAVASTSTVEPFLPPDQREQLPLLFS
jgi:hypothetical protein